MPRRLPGRAIQAGTITVTQLETSVANTVQTGGGPKITNVEVTSNSYVVLDDTAVDIAGGYIKITGTGFAAGCQVLINNTPATSTTFIGPTEVRAQLPATAAGTYMLYLINADGGVAIRVNGVTFSATPSWVTASDLTSYALGDAISIQLAATGASTFALAAGSTLPTGLTLSAGGLLSGSVTGLENDTSYSFTITAIDAENQDSPRTFSITITVQLQVSRSLRFNSADSAHVLRTFGATGNLQTFSVSCWFKRSALGASNPIFVAGTDVADYMFITFTSGDIISVTTGETGTTNLNLINSTAVFRDTAAWYHLVVAFDFANATSTDRIRVFVNGVRQTMTGTYASSSFTGTRHNRAGILHYIGRWPNGSSFFNGYITEFYFIDGLALDPTSFAETNTTTGQYIPKKYTGTYGTNGFYLPFTDNSSVANLGRNYQPLTADPFWPQTVLLLNGTGTNNAQNNTFIDSSTNAFAITRNGNVSQGRFSPFSLGGYSYFFGDSSTNSKLTAASNAAFAIGTGNFTVEFFINFTAWASTEQRFFGQSVSGTNGLVLGRTVGTEAIILNTANGTGSNTIITYTWTPVLGRWYHMAVVRSGTGSNQVALYIDGTVVATGTSSDNIAQNQFVVGSGWADSYALRGYLSCFRYSNVARTISIPTQDLTSDANTLLLTAQRNRFVDQSGYAHALTVGTTPSVQAFSPFTPTTAYSAATNGGSAYFDGTGDYLTAGSDAAFAYGTGAYTVEFWMYPSNLNLQVFLVNLTTNGLQVWYDTTQGIAVGAYGSSPVITTGIGFFLASQWNHVVVTRASTSAGQAAIFINGTRRGSGTDANNYTITGPLNIGGQGASNVTTGYMSSLRLVKGTAVYDPTQTTLTVPTAPVTAVANTQLLLNFVNAGIVDATGDNNIETVGDAKISTAQSKWGGSSIIIDNADRLGTKKLVFRNNYSLDFGTGDFTIEAWIYLISLSTGNNQAIIASGSGGVIFVVQYTTNVLVIANYGGNSIAGSTALSAGQWYHVAATRNSGTTRLFLNGIATVTSSTSLGSLVASSNINVGQDPINNLDQGFNGYIQDLRITRAARYTGNFTPPTAQFAYNQGDINYNQWVPTNFSVTAGAGNDSLLDVPTNWGVDTGLGGEVRGNYCTINTLMQNTSVATISDGALRAVTGTSGVSSAYMGTIGFSSGKWYWEVFVEAVGTNNMWIGVTKNQAHRTVDAYTNTWTYNKLGQKTDNAATGSAYGAAYTTGDIIGVAVDADIGSITFYKNGASQGVAFTGLSMSGGVYTVGGSDNSATMVFNFGQRPFAYAAPAGFKSLNTHNLPALAVAKSNTAFDAVTWTGDGNTTRSITGLQFSPDLLWYKNRSVAVNNYINDTIRGAGAGTHMHTNTTNTEASASVYATNGGLQSFDANGFTGYKGSDATYQAFNLLNNNYVAWAWDAGTTTVVNTAGSISANVRVNASAGISIATFATLAGGGGTFGHGLGVAPKFIIQKSRTGAQDWYVYHASLGASAYMLLNSSAASVSSTAVWGGTTPSSAIVTLGSGWINTNHGNVVAYCFAEVPGFSAFGNYTGNNSTDGSFVYTGFRPAFVMIKSYSGAFDQAYASWTLYDNKRNPTNKATNPLFPNLSAAEGARGNGSSQPNVLDIDILSNGFKIRASATESNYGSYIYAAFAESPFKYARAR